MVNLVTRPCFYLTWNTVLTLNILNICKGSLVVLFLSLTCFKSPLQDSYLSVLSFYKMMNYSYLYQNIFIYQWLLLDHTWCLYRIHNYSLALKQRISFSAQIIVLNKRDAPLDWDAEVCYHWKVFLLALLLAMQKYPCNIFFLKFLVKSK